MPLTLSVICLTIHFLIEVCVFASIKSFLFITNDTAPHFLFIYTHLQFSTGHLQSDTSQFVAKFGYLYQHLTFLNVLFTLLNG